MNTCGTKAVSSNSDQRVNKCILQNVKLFLFNGGNEAALFKNPVGQGNHTVQEVKKAVVDPN